MQTTTCCDSIIQKLKHYSSFSINDYDCNDLTERNVKTCVDLVNLHMKVTMRNKRLFYSSIYYTGVMDGDEMLKYRFKVLPDTYMNRICFRLFNHKVIDT
jgi:hypothetical protein